MFLFQVVYMMGQLDQVAFHLLHVHHHVKEVFFLHLFGSYMMFHAFEEIIHFFVQIGKITFQMQDIIS